MFIYWVVLSLGGCRKNSSLEQTQPQTTGAVDTSPEAMRARAAHAEDPAMAPRPEPAAPVETTLAAASSSEPTRTVVDLSGHRVFLPGKGWLSADAFWNIVSGSLPATSRKDWRHKLGEKLSHFAIPLNSCQTSHELRP